MTQEEILALKPGRELDIAVAIALMDYVWATHMLQFSAEMEVKWLASPEELAEAGGVVIKVKEERLHTLKLREQYEESVAFYSKDPVAADAVWRKISALDASWRKLNEDGSRLQSERWLVECATYPEAVAKAALLEKNKNV
ncbi:hypothetical protein [Azotosporobacter soli]|uniref:hypothetical protein n=1 Tax=Azotosporobacter soli TaxID=3055040 RepID=UPI0031FE652E